MSLSHLSLGKACSVPGSSNFPLGTHRKEECQESPGGEEVPVLSELGSHNAMGKGQSCGQSCGLSVCPFWKMS